MSFFKGYVMTENKKCIEKFKDRTDFKTLEQVQSLPEYAGILAPDAILIDIDDEEKANRYTLTCMYWTMVIFLIIWVLNVFGGTMESPYKKCSLQDSEKPVRNALPVQEQQSGQMLHQDQTCLRFA